MSVTVNPDLHAKAKRAGINVSRVAEQVVAEAYSKKRAESISAEIQQDLAAGDDYASRHCDCAGPVSARYDRDDGAV